MPELLDTTGEHRCDNVVEGFIGAFELAFPGRLHACYLRGSRASGASINGSDLDLYLVVKNQFVDGVEYERAQQLTDNASAAAVAAVVGASGALSSYETVVLLTPTEMDEAMKRR